jgi:hypothetical protein
LSVRAVRVTVIRVIIRFFRVIRVCKGNIKASDRLDTKISLISQGLPGFTWIIRVVKVIRVIRISRIFRVATFVIYLHPCRNR